MEIIWKCWHLRIKTKDGKWRMINVFHSFLMFKTRAMRRVKGLQLLTGRQASLSADQEWSNNAIDENIFTLINCILVYFQMNFQGFVYFCNEIGVNVSNFSRNAISIVVFQLNLYNHFSPKRDILFNGIRYLFQRINIFHTSCFYYMEIKGII